MVLEAILYFILGFLSAALLALMVSPVIWNRAIVLTKRKIESSIPLSLNEIQADKDQLRAEFAMSTRRLEMSVDELREKASNQLVEINRRRDEVNRLNIDGKERLSELRVLEAKCAEQGKNLEEREKRLAELTDRHMQLQDEHDALLDEVGKLRIDYSDNQQSLKSREIELTANKATIEALKGTVSTIDMSDNQQLSTISKLQDQLAASKERLVEEKQNTKEAIERAKSAEKELKTATRTLEKNTKKISEIQDNKEQDGQAVADLTAKLIDEQAKTVELEAKLAKQALQTEALLNDASNENVEEALRSLNSDLDEKSTAFQTLKKERDQLATELDAIKSASNDDWSDERQEKAFLRQRINDLAAKVAVVAAEFEGDKSPIHEMLDEEEVENSKKETLSLADRIRAVQEAANS